MDEENLQLHTLRKHKLKQENEELRRKVESRRESNTTTRSVQRWRRKKGTTRPMAMAVEKCWRELTDMPENKDASNLEISEMVLAEDWPTRLRKEHLERLAYIV